MSLNGPSGLVRKVMFVGFGLLFILLPLAPYASTGPQAAADLFFAFAVVWVLRDPVSAPAWILVPMALLADLLLSKPFGLGALTLLAATETIRAHSDWFRNARFPVQWVMFIVSYGLLLSVQVLILRLTSAPVPSTDDMLRTCIATAVVFPPLLLFVAKGLGVGRRKSRFSGDTMGWTR